MSHIRPDDPLRDEVRDRYAQAALQVLQPDASRSVTTSCCGDGCGCTPLGSEDYQAGCCGDTSEEAGFGRSSTTHSTARRCHRQP